MVSQSASVFLTSAVLLSVVVAASSKLCCLQGGERVMGDGAAPGFREVQDLVVQEKRQRDVSYQHVVTHGLRA